MSERESVFGPSSSSSRHSEEPLDDIATLNYQTESKAIRVMAGLTVGQAFRLYHKELGFEPSRPATYLVDERVVGENEVLRAGSIYRARVERDNKG